MLGIVILNYLNWWDTIELIKTIEAQTFQNYEIIIIDNCSTNDSIEKLEKLYKDHRKIHLIKASENQGFARGNNIGIKYCIEKFNLRKILLLNNDTLLFDNNYLEKLVNIVYTESVGAIGTRILDKNNQNQNPVYNVNSLRESSVGFLRSTTIYKFMRPLLRYFKKVFSHTKKENFLSKKGLSSGKNESYILHGSAILLTENYLNLYPGLYPETFMFFEENILDFLLKKNSLNKEYHSELAIKHKEDQSSKLAFEDIDSKKQMMLVDSWYIYLKLRLMSKKKIQKKFLAYSDNSMIKF